MPSGELSWLAIWATRVSTSSKFSHLPRNCCAPLHHRGENAAVGFHPQGQRGNVDQHDVLHLVSCTNLRWTIQTKKNIENCLSPRSIHKHPRNHSWNCLNTNRSYQTGASPMSIAACTDAPSATTCPKHILSEKLQTQLKKQQHRPFRARAALRRRQVTLP